MSLQYFWQNLIWLLPSFSFLTKLAQFSVSPTGISLPLRMSFWVYTVSKISLFPLRIDSIAYIKSKNRYFTKWWIFGSKNTKAYHNLQGKLEQHAQSFEYDDPWICESSDVDSLWIRYFTKWWIVGSRNARVRKDINWLIRYITNWWNFGFQSEISPIGGSSVSTNTTRKDKTDDLPFRESSYCSKLRLYDQ